MAEVGSRAKTKVRDTLKVSLTRYPRVYDLARMPYALARYALRAPHDLDYQAFSLFPRREGIFLDVGANAGMSALSFRVYNRTMPIVSVEPNPFHRRDLRLVSRVVRPHKFIICAAGDREGEFDLYIPVYRGVPLTTEASLDRDEVAGSGSLRARLGAAMDSPDFAIVTQRVPVHRLDAFHFRPAFIKLDVQGAELNVLSGLLETVELHKPLLLVETPSEAVCEMLAGFGYSPYVYDQNRRGLTPGAERTNVFFAV